MKDTIIYTTARKQLLLAEDAKHYLSVLFQFPEGEWFTPTNKHDEAYTICKDLADVHLLSVKRVPIWRNGSFHGIAIYFLYHKDLNYQQ